MGDSPWMTTQRKINQMSSYMATPCPPIAGILISLALGLKAGGFADLPKSKRLMGWVVLGKNAGTTWFRTETISTTRGDDRGPISHPRHLCQIVSCALDIVSRRSSVHRALLCRQTTRFPTTPPSHPVPFSAIPTSAAGPARIQGEALFPTHSLVKGVRRSPPHTWGGSAERRELV